MNIKTVTVIGASGIMGANIAGIFASFGDATVYCLGRDIRKIEENIPRMVNSVRADSIKRKLIPVDYSAFEECVSKSDLVFESSAEDIRIKKEIASRIASCMGQGTLSCTGTSGLSIAELSKCYSEEQRKSFFGVHLFNPPYNMPLCELISTQYSDLGLKGRFKEYLEKKLNRIVVEVKDSPAFLANRIGFQFINEAMQYAEMFKDNGGIDYIDAILGSFTGRTMPPLVTADFVGLDVHKAIVDNVKNNSKDYANNTFELPMFVEELIKANKLGKKSGEGLYKTVKNQNGSKYSMVYDINSNTYRDRIEYAFPFSKEMRNSIREGDYSIALQALIKNHSQEAEICLNFLLKYIVYALHMAETVGYSIESADDVMAAGFNWCPPLALYQAFDSVTDAKKLIKDKLDGKIDIDIDQVLLKVRPSKYDYRQYFKSGK